MKTGSYTKKFGGCPSHLPPSHRAPDSIDRSAASPRIQPDLAHTQIAHEPRARRCSRPYVRKYTQPVICFLCTKQVKNQHYLDSSTLTLELSPPPDVGADLLLQHRGDGVVNRKEAPGDVAAAKVQAGVYRDC